MDYTQSNKGNEENNYDDIDRQIKDAHKKREQKRKNVKLDNGFLDEVINAKVINKRVMGKVMLTYCGNEGAEHDDRTRSLRKLLQAVIDYIQVNPCIKWNNAEVTIYDIDDNSFRIISGEGKHQYVVTDDGKGGAEVINTGNKVQKQTPVKQPQPTKETASAYNKGNEENNYDDIERQIKDAHTKRQQKRQNVKLGDDFLDEVINAKVINKRVMGRVMLTYCGNEGAENDDRTRSLRKLLQAVIDFIQVNPSIKWNNGEVTIYDIDDNSFRIISGEGKHQYVVTDDGKGGAEVINTGNKVHKQTSAKQPDETKATASNKHNREKRSSHRTAGGFHPYSHSNDSNYQHNHGDYANEKEGEKSCILS